jgi:hypothetical protein
MKTSGIDGKYINATAARQGLIKSSAAVEGVRGQQRPSRPMSLAMVSSPSADCSHLSRGTQARRKVGADKLGWPS